MRVDAEGTWTRARFRTNLLPMRSILIIQLAVLSLAPGARAEGEPMSDVTLRGLAADCGFHIGAAVSYPRLRDDADYGALLARQFNALTAENAHKFHVIHPKGPAYDFTQPDALVEFAEANGMAVRGHTLVWHYHPPRWLIEADYSNEEAEALLKDHIFTVAGRYQGRIAWWDVVNEAVSDATGGGLRESYWLEKVGPDYVEKAFHWAHEADPHAKLFYNDYGCEASGTKTESVYRFVKDLLAKGAPVHGVGLQAHIDVKSSEWIREVAATVERFGELGLEVHITELDVRLPADDAGAERLREQARVYGELLQVCLESPHCTALTMWGFTDRSSWIPAFYKGFGHALPFDADLQPKPAYHEMLRVLSECR